MPITQEQALTLVKSGFTNLEGLRDAAVEDLVDILSVDEAKAREIHEAVHRGDAGRAVTWFAPNQPAMSKIFTYANENHDQDRSAQTRDRSQTGQGRGRS